MSVPTGADAPELIIDGAELLEDLYNRITDYVVLPSDEAAVAVTLWIAATHAQQAWQHATRLRIGSPLKRCGKTRLLDVIENTCHRPVSTVDATIAALFRSIDPVDPPTLIVDEADAIWSKKSNDQTEDLRKLLNSGFGRGRYVLRCVGPNQDVRQFATFAMVAIAGIGDMPDTVTDRAVNITLQRRARGETVLPFRVGRDAPKLHEIRDKLASWIAPQIDGLRAAVPDTPVEDRAADVWEPLLAIADTAGGIWPELARGACLKLASEADVDDIKRSISLQLLSDLRAVFGDEERLPTREILERLRRLDGAPWSDWYGRLFNARDFAGLIRGYGIHAVDVKVAGRSLKGYRRDHFYKSWTSYLAPLDEEPTAGRATSATSATSLVNGTLQVAEVADEETTRDLENALTRGVAQVAQVAHIDGGKRPEYGSCAGCGERMAITELGQTTHPGCETS
jgi:Protein of unknown function (DUF3631)